MPPILALEKISKRFGAVVIADEVNLVLGEGEALEETRCAVMGVFAPIVGIVGATQAAEALKVLAGVGESLAGRLLILDALAMRWRGSCSLGCGA